MSGDVVYHDRDGDGAELEVSTGGTLGVLFVAEADGGSSHVPVSLDRDAVSRLHEQLGAWLRARS